MKTLKYILLGVILSSLVFSSFTFSPPKKGFAQAETVTFCETYTQKEILSKLDPKDSFFTLVHLKEAYPESSRIGTCHEADMKRLWSYIESDAFRSKVQEDLIIAAGIEAKDQMIPLYAIRKSASNDVFPTQQDIDEVSVRESDNEENYALFISFSESGAKRWASMTRLNKGRAIAILFNGKVIAAPIVREEIKNGKCSISGNYTESEINQLKAVLKN
jgi:SecD/SecF fusion protein